MTSWVIPIDRSFAEHWDVAKKHGLWDMSKRFDVATGDLVYFWQAGGSLLSQNRVTAGPLLLAEDTPSPWSTNDPRTYTTRFHFTTLSEAALTTPSWSELVSGLSKKPPPQAPRQFDGADEGVLAAFFPPLGKGASAIEAAIEDLLEQELDAFGDDRREFDWRAVARRGGQPRLRQRLSLAYGGRCAVSGTLAAEVLEAAHISRFKGDHTDQVVNGLLLRADLHTLFDLYRLTVTPDYVVHVAPTLPEPYQALEGQSLHLPTVAKDRPSVALLAKHNAKCDWLAVPTSLV